MRSSLRKRKETRQRRIYRVRKKTKGSKDKPRLSVNKSNKHLFVQLIDDENGVTLASIGTLSKEKKMKKSKDVATLLGQKIAEKAKDKNIKTVVFDRGRFKYQGLLAILADSARKAGLQF